ncbi:hypothetical protein K470DRAFT_257664 [Piedraia hortae CBS 480.64]|uniref:Uncharacterized protein n=1 Tax=Piedraia hortae CBS 480.64 TaxID=1314780 RepID=A0A6A7C1U5_9PEZI|nr:hypothetical protein K470DRAFT_257664 [Piedraia hortae CBS 480.64]
MDLTDSDSGRSSSSSEMDLSDGQMSWGASQTSTTHAGAKRKLEDGPKNSSKKSRVGNNTSGALSLSPALWQRVFLQLPPTALARCLSVCRTFHTLLTHSKTSGGKQVKGSEMDSEAIWAEARKNYLPTLPRPLLRCSELQMLQLLGGKRCQFCRRSPGTHHQYSPYSGGPGIDGVRIIWPFGIRTCGLCWGLQSMQDLELIMSPAASLRFGLPFALQTPELHYVPDFMRTQVGGIPQRIRAHRMYYRPDVEAIQADYVEAKGLGSGAADEWTKGLTDRGHEAMADAARWEKWESQTRPIDLAALIGERDLDTDINRKRGLPRSVRAAEKASAVERHPKRGPLEVAQVLASRKAEIERRCSELQPPLMPEVLHHMEAFQAALKIGTPLTKAQWAALKPRLLSQRDAAENAERERLQQPAATYPIEQQVTPKALEDQESKQLRDCLSKYADEAITQWLSDGRAVNTDTATHFAIHVLLHVAEKAGCGGKASGKRLGSGVSLESMKWVYDHKVRNFTDAQCRELFICAACCHGSKPKRFALEGLLQHYGSKHTKAFGKGNVAVLWQSAKWPNNPPFKVERPGEPPGTRKKASQQPVAENVLLSKNPLFAENNTAGSVSQVAGAQETGDDPNVAFQNRLESYHTGRPFLGQQVEDAPGTVHSPSQTTTPRPVQPSCPPISQLSLNGMESEAKSEAAELLMKEFSHVANQTWIDLDGLPDLHTCVRVHVALHKATWHVYNKFQQLPDLDMVTAALFASDAMQPIRNAQNIACRACLKPYRNSARPLTYNQRIQYVKLHDMGSLVRHFGIAHQPRAATGPLNWYEDMVELPESRVIAQLKHAPGMTDKKLSLLAAAFPTVFNSQAAGSKPDVSEPARVEEYDPTRPLFTPPAGSKGTRRRVAENTSIADDGTILASTEKDGATSRQVPVYQRRRSHPPINAAPVYRSARQEDMTWCAPLPQHDVPTPLQYRPVGQPPLASMYVDEHGRMHRLVPVNAVPAAVQYVPHLQQQYVGAYVEPQPRAYAAPQAVRYVDPARAGELRKEDRAHGQQSVPYVQGPGTVNWQQLPDQSGGHRL